MHSISAIGAVAGLAFVLSLWLTAVIKPLALHWNFVDEPDGRRKVHTGVIPLGGGLAVAVSIFLALILYAFLSSSFLHACRENVGYLLGLLLASLAVCVVGVVDDGVGLRGRQKLFGQLCAVFILLGVSGMSVGKLRIFNLEFELGVLAIPFTVFWLLGAINALNLLDGIDGLAATVGAIASFALAGMCVISERHVDAVVALALGGALLGFLRYNMPPASIFLGDTGSMLIGFLLGALAIHSTLKGPATVALAAPVAILAIPILDSSAAILRRKLTGKSIYTTDRGHMHHVIMSRGFSNRATVAIIAVASIGTCTAALLSVYWKSEVLAGISVLILILVLVAGRLFGYAEYLLLRDRMFDLGRSIVRKEARAGVLRETSVHVQGSRDWNQLWTKLRPMIEPCVVRIRFVLDLPSIQEGFHGRWERASDHDESIVFSQILPVVVDDLVVGRLEVVGLLNGVDAGTVQRAALRLHQFIRQETVKLIGNGLNRNEHSSEIYLMDQPLSLGLS